MNDSSLLNLKLSLYALFYAFLLIALHGTCIFPIFWKLYQSVCFYFFSWRTRMIRIYHAINTAVICYASPVYRLLYSQIWKVPTASAPLDMWSGMRVRWLPFNECSFREGCIGDSSASGVGVESPTRSLRSGKVPIPSRFRNPPATIIRRFNSFPLDLPHLNYNLN